MGGVVIVGAGHGGSQLAVSLRQEGYENPIVLICDEPEYPYHRPPLSKAFLKGADDSLQPLRGEAIYVNNAIDYRPGKRVERIDAAARFCIVDGEAIAFDKLVLATGAVPRRPTVKGDDLDGVFALRTATDARRIKSAMATARNVVIVGGGFIGLEIAATMAAAGKGVTVLEIGERLLARAVSPLISTHVLARLAGAGVDVWFGTASAEFLGEGTVNAVRTHSGDEISADMVVVGIGADPDVALAVEAGIAVDGGIVVDAQMQTSAEGVFAIGDCARFPHWQLDRSIRLESVQNATDQARHLAGVIAGKHQEPYTAVPWFWSDIADMKLQMVGLSMDADDHVVAGDPVEGAFAVYHFRQGRLIAIDSVNRPADHMLGRKMIAAGYTPAPQEISDGTVGASFKRWSAAASAAPKGQRVA
ncbi:FAD-dependent oxidoreductase [Mesorhizobium sediminum]|uniref:FAD-dependent oxidoreductase n=1 Tax=Neoaquamicrobium sediminum TaxID=1849104 RepID=A0ABV3WWK7_9HYPH